MGLFAFGDVIYSFTNLFGLFLNTVGVSWYAWIKIAAQQQKLKESKSNGNLNGSMNGNHNHNDDNHILPVSQTKTNL